MDAAPDVADPILVNDVIQQLKSEGTFDQFRRDCLGDVDTKPAYQNLRQRVESYVSNFLSGVTWSPTMNKNHLRDSLRRQINQSEILAIGVERVIEQVVDPQIQHVFRPKLEEVLQGILKVDLDTSPAMLLPGSTPTTSSSNPPPFSSESNQSSPFVSKAPPGQVSATTTPPPTVVSSSLSPPPLPCEAPPLPSSSPPPLPEEAPPPPLPESVAPPPPPEEPPPAPELQDMDIDIESPEATVIEESIQKEPEKPESFKFMKNLLHKAKEKIKSFIGDKEEKPTIEEKKTKVEPKVIVEEVQEVEMMTLDKNDDLDLIDDFDNKKDKEHDDDDNEDEVDRLTDITVSSVHTSDLSSFTEGISSSSSSSELSDSESDEELKKSIDDAENPGERSLSRSSSMATDSDKGSSKGSGKKSSNLALAISRYHSDSDEDMEKRQERRRKAAVAREERAALRQQAREEHQRKIEQMKAERLAKKRKKALQEKSSTSDEDADEKAERREKRTRSIQLKEQMKEKLLEKKKEKKRMAYASLSDETLSPRKNVKSKQTDIYRFDLVARKLKKPVVKYHHLLCKELTGEEQIIASNKNYRGPDFKRKILAKKAKLERAKRKLESELSKTEGPSDDSNITDNDENIADQIEKSSNMQNIDTPEFQKIDDVEVDSASIKDSHEGKSLITGSEVNLGSTEKILEIESKTSGEVHTKNLEDETQRSEDIKMAESNLDMSDDVECKLEDKIHESADVEVSDSSNKCQMKVDALTDSFNKETENNDNVVIADSSIGDEFQKSECVTEIGNFKDGIPKSENLTITCNTMEKSQTGMSEDVGSTMTCKVDQKKDIDDIPDRNVEDVFEKTDKLPRTDTSQGYTEKREDVVVADIYLEKDISLKCVEKKTDDQTSEEIDTSTEKEAHVQIGEDYESLSSNVEPQESEKDDISEENPPTPTQDEPSTLEEIAEVEPAAIPIYSLSPAAYQGPKIGSLFKVGKDEAEKATEPEESSASSPLSAISSGDLSGGEEEEEEEKESEDVEPDEEGEIKEETESVTEEKPSEELKTEGRYGMRSRRKIHSPRYSDDEYLLYGFKKTRSSGSMEEKGSKETKAVSKTKMVETERITRKSSRTESLAAAKEEGEVDEQPEPKKKRKASTEDNSSIMSGRRQRQVPRRYSPSESVTGRRAPSPTAREPQTRPSTSRYAEQQGYGERRTRKQSSPTPPQKEGGRSRRAATPPKRGLRRPSGDRTSENYPPAKRKR